MNDETKYIDDMGPKPAKKLYLCPACRYRGEGIPMYVDVPGRSPDHKGVYCPGCVQEWYFRNIPKMTEVIRAIDST